MTKQEALEAIIDICEEAWHVRGSGSVGDAWQKWSQRTEPEQSGLFAEA